MKQYPPSAAEDFNILGIFNGKAEQNLITESLLSTYPRNKAVYIITPFKQAGVCVQNKKSVVALCVKHAKQPRTIFKLIYCYNDLFINTHTCGECDDCTFFIQPIFSRPINPCCIHTSVCQHFSLQKQGTL